MEHRSAFRFIDLLTGKHLFNCRFESAFLSQIQKKFKCSLVQQVFGEIKQIIIPFYRELIKSFGVVIEKGAKLKIILCKMFAECFPCIGMGRIYLWQHKVQVVDLWRSL